ncbi:MAG: hypothetical protein ACI8Y7_000896 [Candidatus Woesearchaeota archaeon]|jgi:hypothetical protein
MKPYNTEFMETFAGSTSKTNLALFQKLWGLHEDTLGVTGVTGEAYVVTEKLFREAIEFRMKDAYYAFTVELTGTAGDNIGIEYFRRVGKNLEELSKYCASVDRLRNPMDAIECFKEEGVTQVHTGRMAQGGFLGLDNYSPANGMTLEYETLDEEHTEALIAAGIEVVVLNPLI